jgi:hypothetical protein
MITQKAKGLERYFATENEHWNKYAFDMLCKALQEGTFENPEVPLQLFERAISILTEHWQTPLQAVQQVDSEAEKHSLATEQKVFILEWVCKYVTFSDFEEIDMGQVAKILESQLKQLKKKPKVEDDKPLTESMRETLKMAIQAELNQLPETLKKLDSMQRMNILSRFLPYVLPKVESVTRKLGEPDTDNNGFKW